MKEFVVEVVRSVAGEGMRPHWRKEGIYRASSRAAQRWDEQWGMRRDDGWKRDPCHERERGEAAAIGSIAGEAASSTGLHPGY
jgi:hypothetical protein